MRDSQALESPARQATTRSRSGRAAQEPDFLSATSLTFMRLPPRPAQRSFRFQPGIAGGTHDYLSRLGLGAGEYGSCRICRVTTGALRARAFRPIKNNCPDSQRGNACGRLASVYARTTIAAAF